MFEHLNSPVTLGTLRLRNRIAMSAMGVEIAEEDGHAREPIIAYYEERARGGVGLIITEVCAVAYPRGATAHRQLAISSDDHLPGLRELTDRVHRHGAKIALQMVHHGKVARVDVKEGRPVLMPSLPRFKGANDMANDLSREEIGLLMAAAGTGAGVWVGAAARRFGSYSGGSRRTVYSRTRRPLAQFNSSRKLRKGSRTGSRVEIRMTSLPAGVSSSANLRDSSTASRSTPARSKASGLASLMLRVSKSLAVAPRISMRPSKG